MLKCKTYFLIELNKSIKTKHKYFKNMSELIITFTYDLSDIITSDVPVLTQKQKRASIYNDVTYNVLKYNKKLLTPETISTYGLCRSVILNNEQRIVSFAPPKSMAPNFFLEKYPLKTPLIVAEEMVEGTMINVFWDGVGWEVATRSSVGAQNKFYMPPNPKTFFDMFQEAADQCGLKLENLNQAFCYSFVLQHPENKMVVEFEIPALYLVAVYKINNPSHTVDVIDPRSCNLNIGLVKFPEIYEFNTWDDLKQRFETTDINILGTMIHNLETGERTKIRNSNYEQVRRLRGNQPKLKYQYLVLRKSGKDAEYLSHFSEHTEQFNKWKEEISKFTSDLYDNYVSCFITKTKLARDCSYYLKKTLYSLHDLYFGELKGQSKKITRDYVSKFVDNLHPSILMTILKG